MPKQSAYIGSNLHAMQSSYVDHPWYSTAEWISSRACLNPSRESDCIRIQWVKAFAIDRTSLNTTHSGDFTI